MGHDSGRRRGSRPSPLRLLAACLALGCAVVGLHLLRPALLARIDLLVRAIVAGRGIQFDPDMVDAFLRVQEHWRRIAIDFADEHEHPSAEG